MTLQGEVSIQEQIAFCRKKCHENIKEKPTNINYFFKKLGPSKDRQPNSRKEVFVPVSRYPLTVCIDLGRE